jgi:hypothetical protein
MILMTMTLCRNEQAGENSRIQNVPSKIVPLRLEYRNDCLGRVYAYRFVAQRAFRLRKEQYIKKLEERVGEIDNAKEQVALLESENYQLRSYILSLQHALLEGERDVPAPPSNIDLSQPRTAITAASAREEATLRSAASAAQAVAELAVAEAAGREAAAAAAEAAVSTSVDIDHPSKRNGLRCCLVFCLTDSLISERN